MSKHGVRFAPGTIVSPGEYRNCDSGAVRYFDGSTPIPGGVNSASWQQISDHYHAEATTETRRHAPEQSSPGVRFAPGAVVSPGEYRNSDTGAVRYFDGSTPIPGSTNSASWQQISDHYHATDAGESSGGVRHRTPDRSSHSVRFAPGTIVSPGEYRNCETGAVRYFDGNTPLPGKVNAASWQQISDHYHAGAARAGK